MTQSNLVSTSSDAVFKAVKPAGEAITQALNELSRLASSNRDQSAMPYGAVVASLPCLENPIPDARAIDLIARRLGEPVGTSSVREALSRFFTKTALDRLFRIQSPYWFWNVVAYSAASHRWTDVHEPVELPLDIEVVEEAIWNFRVTMIDSLNRSKTVLAAIKKNRLDGLPAGAVLYLVSIGVALVSPQPDGQMKVVLSGIFDDESQLC